MTREQASRRRGRGDAARDATSTTSSSRPRTRRAATSTSCAAVVEAVDRGGRDDDQPARHGRLRDAGRDRASSSRGSAPASPNADTAVFSAHCHNDLGLAVANTPGGGRGGRAAGRVHDQRHRRAGGQRVARGDRHGAAGPAGSAALHDGHRHAAALSRPASSLRELTGELVQANKAIVGRNAFAHEAGIHQDGVLKDRRTYEIMRPEDVGVPETTLVLGKHSGRHALKAPVRGARHLARAARSSTSSTGA